MADLFIRDDEGRAHYRVNAREEGGRFVVEPRGMDVEVSGHSIHVLGAHGRSEQVAEKALDNPLMRALVRRVGAVEHLPDSITEACVEESDPAAALARLDQVDLQWIINRCLRPLEAVRVDMAVTMLRRQIGEETRAQIQGSAFWMSEVRDA